MIQVLIGRAGSPDIPPHLIDSMLRVRYQTFHERLGWEVTVSQGREFDFYDALGPVYVIATDTHRQECLGCLRLLPTTGPNMLRDLFAELLECPDVPDDPTCWEVSRFALAPTAPTASARFSEVPTALLEAMMHFAREQGIRRIVGVTTTAIERMVRILGWEQKRLGNMHLIGTARTVVISLPVPLSTSRPPSPLPQKKRVRELSEV